MSCPFKQTDLMRQCAYCAVSDAKVDRVLICDVDYNYCPDYLKSKQTKAQHMRRAIKREVAKV